MGIAAVAQRPASMARLLLDRVTATPGREAFRYPFDDRWEPLDWRQVRQWVRTIAAGCAAAGATWYPLAGGLGDLGRQIQASPPG